MEHENNGDTNYNWFARNSSQKLSKGSRRAENRRICHDLLNYNITKIGQNTEKSPGDLRRLAVTHTLVKDHHLTLCPVGWG